MTQALIRKLADALEAILQGSSSLPKKEYIPAQEALIEARAWLETGGWQTMDSAPKDGETIMVWEQEDAEPWIAYWAAGGWRTTYADEILGIFTHWQPRPSSPTAQLEKE